MVVHTYNPSTWETETGGSQVRDQPQQLSETLSNLERPCFKIKIGLGVQLRGRMLLGSNFFCVVLGIELRGILPLSYNPTHF